MSIIAYCFCVMLQQRDNGGVGEEGGLAGVGGGEGRVSIRA